MKRLLAVALSLSFAVLSTESSAFPELVRHGYLNCTTCHVAPNGGGTLTPYGRSLSEEILSTWRYEGEGQFAYGVVKPPEWLIPGGDFRFLQLLTDSPSARDARPIFMQNDLEAAVQAKKFTADATLGYNDQSGTVLDHVISRRHYLMYQATDQIAVRGGRFLRAYGINTPDHVLFIKQRLGMDEGMETYNVEASYIGEKVDAFVTGMFGRIDKPSLDADKGVAIRSSVGLGDSYKVGASYTYATNDRGNRHLVGPYGILGFTKRFFVLAETDLQNQTASTGTGAGVAKLGVASYLRVDYEVIQGLHFYVTHQYFQTKFGDGMGVNAYGGGIQFFPRPHFEVHGTATRSVLPANAGNVDAFALLLHFYP